jgi:NADH-quinone oxidoreductase subunit H
LPFGLNQFLDGLPAKEGQILPLWLEGLLSVGVFIGKVVAILFVYVIIRWTLPRFKYNQLMDLGWKRLVPLALFNVALVAVVGVLTGGTK